MADFDALAQAERILSAAKDEKDSRHRDDRDRRRHDDRRDYGRRDDDRYTPRRDDYDRRDRYRRHDRDDRRRDDRHDPRHDRGRRRRDDHATPERRSPTPDGAAPLSKRIRRASGWDVCAPGYEGYSAMQAKHTGASHILALPALILPGMFNLPGANRTQIVPNILGMTGALPPIHYGQGSFAPGPGAPNLARQSRRLYVGNITYEANETNLQDFFNRKMAEMNIGTGGAGDPVIGVQINHEKSYAFVEFRSAEDATAAMAFDGIMFQSGPLKIRRPKDYTGSDLSAPMGVHVPGVVSTNVPDSINKIFVGGLPTYLDENQVMELLKSFGELKAFNLVRENGNGASKVGAHPELGHHSYGLQGFAFFEYVDPSVTDIAIQGLNGMELGDRFLVVQRASVGAKIGIPGVPPELFAPAIPRPIMPITETADPNPNEDTILLLLNMVAPEDLVDDTEFAEIVEDVRDECSKFGPVRTVAIPRPAKKEKSKWDANAGALVTAGGAPLNPGAVGASSSNTKTDEQRGVGRVYVKFERPDGASAALRGLAGRAFAGRSIIATLLADDADHSPPLVELFPNDLGGE
ncbi:U2 snRNP auxilliary factor, large subunit, splicing factor [Ceratobasidium theobromae]|uniref:Splicing factor U2AF subunit n=1 Tax=Ceratobasidium theobromae TaxID=1582974 RepID=A0A5N5QSZ8_9AGAM|nr:U2 snRNP auxilliary factor, large subunit, splicing factor [Ceratobasidium theobromae]